jgi:F0F1-type ATP synthase delta subunit
MHYSYIQAALKLLRDGQEAEVVVRGLRAVLAGRGCDNLLPRVLRGVLRELEGRFDPKTPHLTFAGAASEMRARAGAKQALAKLAARAEPMVAFDPTIVGGYVAEFNHVRIDASHKRALKELYRTATAA